MNGPSVFIVMTHGHSIRGIWTTHASAVAHCKRIREATGESPDIAVECWEVALDVVLHGQQS